MRKLLALLLVLAPLAPAAAEVPVRTEQFIYTLLAYNGKDYSATFAAESSDALYVLAGVDSFLSTRKTLVYFWPLTGEWKTDTDSLNWPFYGTLEIRDASGRTREVPVEKFTYFNVRGEYELNWKVAKGEAASGEYARYMSLYQDYFKAADAFREESSRYNRAQDELLQRILKARDAGQDPAPLVEKMKGMSKPVQPETPKDYVVPPGEPQESFILNLPRGEYRVRLKNPDGTVMEGSDRRLVAHERRRASAIGYEVIPADKWTRPEQSVTPSSVLHVNGRTDLYIRPFYQDEFAEMAYARTVNNEARGNPNIFTWVRTQQVPHAEIQARSGSAAPVVLREQPYFVEQSKGSSLGYTIVPFDPQGVHKGKEANLIAFRMTVPPEGRTVSFRTLDADGRPLAGSERQIRIVRAPPSAALLLVLAAAPLLVMVLVLVVRSRRYSA
jgi:hypothetical protein